MKLVFTKNTDKSSEGDISHFQALSTAMAATVGTGNIVGVATAVILGDQVLFSGCGSQHSSGWPRNTVKRFSQSNTV
nr:alanine:cation symporter family protein [Planococcus faecalis]